MGFGSYDESEQRIQEIDTDTDESDDEDFALHEHDHEGTVSFESGASTDDLVDRLGSILADAEKE